MELCSWETMYLDLYRKFYWNSILVRVLLPISAPTSAKDIWSRMIQKVCAVFDLCGLGLVFDGIQWAAFSSGKYVSSLLYIDREARHRAARDANAIAQFEDYFCELRF